MAAGVLNSVSIKKESVWGTAVVPDKSLPVSFSGGIKTDIALEELTQLKGTLAKNYNTLIGARTHEGEFEMELFPDYPAYFALSAMGAVTSTAKSAPNAAVYDHVITEAETKPSLTIEQAITNNVRRFAGAIATGFKISAKAGETVKFTTGIKAKSQATATAITTAYATTRPFNFNEVAFKVASTQISEVTSLELEYKNNVEFLHALSSSNDPNYSYVKGSEVTGKVEMFLDATSTAVMTDYLAKTDKAIDIVMTGDTIGTSSNNGLAISIPKATYKTAVTEIKEDFNLLTVEFVGYYDTATSKLLSVTFTNLLTALS
jgi:hypothetical protein